MNEELKRQTYQKKYMQKKKMLCVCLDKKNDEDIIDWMNQQVSITDSVKRALRNNIMPTEEEIRIEKIEYRLDRIEKFITTASGGIRIGIQEQHGWGISNQQLDEIRSIITEIMLEQEVK